MKDSIWSAPGGESPQEPIETEVERVERLLRLRFEEIPGTTWEEKLKTLSSCNCCERHKKRRPKYLLPWVDLNPQGPISQETNCSCNCRHMARFICRQCEDDGSMPECPIGSPYPG
tara:strand:+ start:276 stop:623 length:348 start_codon:yes stop_codon:yes gene_type:complete